MEIFNYITADGDDWGIWAEGHVNKGAFLLAALEELGEPLENRSALVEHTYLAHRPTHEDDEHCTQAAARDNFHGLGGA